MDDESPIKEMKCRRFAKTLTEKLMAHLHVHPKKLDVELKSANRSFLVSFIFATKIE